MSDDPTVDQKAEELARVAAERAALLATAQAERAQEIAVARAVRDANVDRDLTEHARHLEHIDGSQDRMAKSLDALEKSFADLNTSTQAVADYVAEQTSGQLSKRTLWIGGLAATATWVAIIATLVTSIH